MCHFFTVFIYNIHTFCLRSAYSNLSLLIFPEVFSLCSVIFFIRNFCHPISLMMYGLSVSCVPCIWCRDVCTVCGPKNPPGSAVGGGGGNTPFPTLPSPHPHDKLVFFLSSPSAMLSKLSYFILLLHPVHSLHLFSLQ